MDRFVPSFVLINFLEGWGGKGGGRIVYITVEQRVRKMETDR